jgi:hypothetical protein
MADKIAEWQRRPGAEEQARETERKLLQTGPVGAPRTTRQQLIDLTTRAFLALRWCDEHEGECLADHPSIMRRFRVLLNDLGNVRHD